MKHETFQSFDGAELSFWVEGQGTPVLMLHGFLANAHLNWIDPGIAGAIVAAGFRAIMPDLRGHGLSAQHHDTAFAPDVLACDAEALIAHLGLNAFDLVGYSLGARTAVRMLVRGARPRRCVLGGMGLSGIAASAERGAFFRDAIVNGQKAQNPQAAKLINAMIARAQLKPAAMLAVLDAQLQTSVGALGSLETPILVLSGRDDNDNGSAEDLAAALPQAQAQRVPGNHLSAVAAPELAQAIVRFLR
jgi:pimeloyl-ACP methyl ester carboxylesterase